MPNTGIIEKEEDGKIVKYKIVEVAIDGNNTVKRTLVPVDTDEQDIPEGSTLLDENETAGLLAKQARPEKLLVGDMVRMRKGDNSVVGSITGKLKTGRFEVRWDNGEKGKYEGKELAKMY